MTSNNAQKRAAKLYQLQYPGTPYPEALRIVSRLAALRPLTSIVSTDPKGRFERFHFEESAWGGLRSTLWNHRKGGLGQDSSARGDGALDGASPTPPWCGAGAFQRRRGSQPRPWGRPNCRASRSRRLPSRSSRRAAEPAKPTWPTRLAGCGAAGCRGDDRRPAMAPEYASSSFFGGQCAAGRAGVGCAFGGGVADVGTD